MTLSLTLTGCGVMGRRHVNDRTVGIDESLSSDDLLYQAELA